MSKVYSVLIIVGSLICIVLDLAAFSPSRDINSTHRKVSVVLRIIHMFYMLWMFADLVYYLVFRYVFGTDVPLPYPFMIGVTLMIGLWYFLDGYCILSFLDNRVLGVPENTQWTPNMLGQTPLPLDKDTRRYRQTLEPMLKNLTFFAVLIAFHRSIPPRA